jgi:hypothetical protein
MSGVQLESGFEVGEASFVSLDQSPDSVLINWRDLLPQFVRNWRFLIHGAGLAIKLQLGNLNPRTSTTNHKHFLGKNRCNRTIGVVVF